jgi:hypothetical protein
MLSEFIAHTMLIFFLICGGYFVLTAVWGGTADRLRKHIVKTTARRRKRVGR